MEGVLLAQTGKPTEAEADAAMALLRRAVAMGYRSPHAYRTEDALGPLRSRDDFPLLMMDLGFPSDPFAPETDAHRCQPQSENETALPGGVENLG